MDSPSFKRVRASPTRNGRFVFDKSRKVNFFLAIKQMIFASPSAAKSLTKSSSSENILTSFSIVANSSNLLLSRPRAVLNGKNGKSIARELEPALSFNAFLERIISYLSPLDRCLLAGTCKMFHEEVFHPRFSRHMDFTSGPNFKIPAGLISLKVAYCSSGLRVLELPDHLKHTDYKNLFQTLPANLDTLIIHNVDVDLRGAFQNRVFSAGLRKLEIHNHKPIKQTVKSYSFDPKEVEVLGGVIKNLREFAITGCFLDDQIVKMFLSGFKNLESLNLERCQGYTSLIFLNICILTKQLRTLRLGGSEHMYNTEITADGLEKFKAYPNLQLKHLALNYCAKVGAKCMQTIADCFSSSLESLEIIRNCFDKCPTLDYPELKPLRRCKNLKKFILGYSRNIDDQISELLLSWPQLEMVGFPECTLQADLSMLRTACPYLTTIDLSGDSWVKYETVNSMRQLPQLEVLRIGHLEHGDNECRQLVLDKDFEGVFLVQLLTKPGNFPRLRRVYFEANCEMSHWLAPQIHSKRPLLQIMFTPRDNSWMNNIEVQLE